MFNIIIKYIKQKQQIGTNVCTAQKGSMNDTPTLVIQSDGCERMKELTTKCMRKKQRTNKEKREGRKEMIFFSSERKYVFL